MREYKSYWSTSNKLRWETGNQVELLNQKMADLQKQLQDQVGGQNLLDPNVIVVVVVLLGAWLIFSA